jgi:1,2-phenylacetyl-CoA epoxidase catalytic subunit
MFDNGVLKETCEFKREKLRRNWINLHKEKIRHCILHEKNSGDKIKDDKTGGHVAHMSENENACRTLAENP